MQVKNTVLNYISISMPIIQKNYKQNQLPKKYKAVAQRFKLHSLLLTGIMSALFFLCGCHNGRPVPSSLSGDTLNLKYSHYLNIIEYDSFSIARIRNPWDTTRLLHTYILIDKQQPVPQNLPEGTIVRIPVEKAVAYSSVHCSLFEQLGKTKVITGICNPEFVMLPEIKKRLSEGLIQDMGDGQNPNLERIIDEHPDILMPSPFENSGSYGKLGSLNIPIIECADYLEVSALARAEWMRFYGRLLGCPDKADSLFDAVETAYNDLTLKAKQASERPKLLCEMRTGATWFVSGGNTATGRMYQDAGAEYLFNDYQKSGAAALTFETVFERAQDADIWLIKYNLAQDLSYNQLKQDYAPYANFKAWKEKNIYGCNTRYIPYYEQTPFQPQLLLEDLIRIFHPELLPEAPLKYFKKLN